MAAHQALSHRSPRSPCRRAALRSTWLALVLLPGLVGCAAAPKMILFMQQQHREAYAFNEQDLARLQFFTSSEVVAQDLDVPRAEGFVLIDVGTPGVAVGAGPGWIRVRFQEGGQGIVFLADPTARGDTGYALATEVEGGRGYSLVRNDDDRVLRLGSQRYRIAIGAYAELLVDRDKLQKLIATRPQVQGQRVP